MAASRSCGPPRSGSWRAQRSARRTLSERLPARLAEALGAADYCPPRCDPSFSIAASTAAPARSSSTGVSTRARVRPLRGSKTRIWIIPVPESGGSKDPVMITSAAGGASPRPAISCHAAGGTKRLDRRPRTARRALGGRRRV